MATALADGNILTCRLNFQLTGQPDRAMNVLHYRVSQVIGAPPGVYEGLAEIGAAIHDHFGPTWGNTASNGVQFNNVTVTNVFPLPRSVTATTGSGAPYQGQIDSDPLPMQDAVTILKRTDVGTRSGLGRTFWCGIPEDGQDAGTISGAQLTLYNTLATKQLQTVAVIGAGWSCNLDLVLLRGPEDNPLTITPVVRCEVSNVVIKTQRRRRPGKGS